MLSDNNQALLRTLETKYVTLLDVAKNIAWISMRNSPAQTELEKYILVQQQCIHEKASDMISNR